jgi:hypothetical protein
MKSIRLLVALAVLAFASACASRGGLKTSAGEIFAYDAMRDINPFTEAEPRVDLNVALRTYLKDAARPSDDAPGLTGFKEFTRLTVLLASHDGERKTIRDAVVGDALHASEQSCARYMASLRGIQVGHRLGFDLVSISAGIAGSLSTGTTAQDWAGVSGLATASSASIDRTVFADQAVELVRLSIHDLRSKSRARIETQLRESSYEEYPLGMALADVSAFHADCSLLHGLGAAREAIETRETAIAAIRAAARGAANTSSTGADVADVVDAVVKAVNGNVLDDDDDQGGGQTG